MKSSWDKTGAIQTPPETLTPFQAAEILGDVQKWWFNFAGAIPLEWQVEPGDSEDSKSRALHFDPPPELAGKKMVYGFLNVDFFVADLKDYPPLDRDRQKIEDGVMAMGLVADPADISLFRWHDGSFTVCDYVALPVEKVSFARMNAMNDLCKQAQAAGLEEIGHLLGYPEFICWAPEKPGGCLTLTVDYGYGGGVHGRNAAERKESLKKVAESIWEELGFEKVEKKNLAGQKEAVKDGKRTGAGFYCLNAGGDSRNKTPYLSINLEHPGLMDRARAALAAYKDAALKPVADAPVPKLPAPGM
jgi:hypothetical protein